MQLARPAKKKSMRQNAFLFRARGDRRGNAPLTEIAECRTRHRWSRDSTAELPQHASTASRAANGRWTIQRRREECKNKRFQESSHDVWHRTTGIRGANQKKVREKNFDAQRFFSSAAKLRLVVDQPLQVSDSGNEFVAPGLFRFVRSC